MSTTRRHFCATAAAIALQPHILRAQGSSRVDVAAIEHDHILAEANLFLKQAPRTITSIPAPKQPVVPGEPAPDHPDPHAFYSEPEAPRAFRAHVDALIDASAAIAALTAAYVLTRDEKYALHAGKHLLAWFVSPDTRMTPTLEGAQPTHGLPGSPASIEDGASLAEIARALPFLADTAALSPPDLDTTHAWFAGFLTWLTTSRHAIIARDTKDHTASAWLLLTSAIARLQKDEVTLTDCRKRFKPTLRNQVSANGDFPHEVQTSFPLRNSLFNFDLLAGVCELLSTPFSSLWPYELEDGPGMRAVAAFLYAHLTELNRWPYTADIAFFREVPRRRPALLLAGRAYARPEYVALWRSLPPPPLDSPLKASFPIRQPLLWTTRAPHGA